MKRNLASLIAAGALIGFSAIFPLRTFSETKKIMDAVYPVEMTLSSTGQKKIEKFKIEAFLDDEKNQLSFSFLTQDYNKKNWSALEQRIPAYQRYTQINGNTKICLLRPELVTIKKMEQSAYFIPQNKTEKLFPMEDHPYMELMFDLADKGIDWVENWLVKEFKIKSAKKIFDKMLNYVQKKEKNYQENLQKEMTPEGYILEQIIPYPFEAGKTETARFYTLYFNVPKTKKDVPLSILAKIGLGRIEPEYSNTPSWTGNLEDVVIEFNFSEKETADTSATTAVIADSNSNNSKNMQKPVPVQKPKPSPAVLSIEDYFPKGKELEKISSVEIPFLGKSINNFLKISNPIIFSEKDTRRFEPNIEGLLQKGMGSYGILNDEGYLDEIGFYMEAYKLGSDKIPQFMKDRTKNSSDLGFFALSSDNFYVFIESFLNYGEGYFDGKTATKKQALNFINFLIGYNNRIKGELIFGEDSKGIKKIFSTAPNKFKDMINKPEDYGLYSSQEAIRYLFSPGIE